MADLLDIASSTAIETVWIDGHRISVRGLSFNHAASIISRFPNVGDLFSTGFDAGVALRLIEQLGASVAPVIAAGCGHPGDEKYEQIAGAMVMDDQAALLESIWRLTLPKGWRPFLERLKRMRSAGEGAKPVKLRLRKSPLASHASSDADSLQTAMTLTPADIRLSGI
jgi:hypothetical protein